MDFNSPTKINFEYFNAVIGETIILPSNTIIYKSYNINYEPISERPSFFGNKDNALKYLKENRVLGTFVTNKTLKLIDIRYLKMILQELFVNRNNNEETTLEYIYTLTLSLGICSLEKQIELFKKRYSGIKKTNKSYQLIQNKIIALENFYKTYKDSNDLIFLNPVELGGVRIGETENDHIMSIILKKLFSDYFDGFIAPNIFSPFYYNSNNYLPCEILLFNPVKSDIKLVQNTEDVENTEDSTKTSYYDLYKVLNMTMNKIKLPIIAKSYFYVQFGGCYEIYDKKKYKKNIKKYDEINDYNTDLIYKMFNKYTNKNIYLLNDLSYLNNKSDEPPNIDIGVTPWSFK